MMKVNSVGSSTCQQVENASSQQDSKIRKSSVQTSGASELKEQMTQNNKAGKQPSEEEIKKAVDEMNKKMVNAEAVFGRHEETGHMTVKIVNKDTKEVIKEFPSEQTMDMIAKVWELAGIIVDEKR